MQENLSLVQAGYLQKSRQMQSLSQLLADYLQLQKTILS